MYMHVHACIYTYGAEKTWQCSNVIVDTNLMHLNLSRTNCCKVKSVESLIRHYFSMGKVNKVYRQCMTAIVHLMRPPFVPDVTIHVDSLEIYMCKFLSGP